MEKKGVRVINRSGYKTGLTFGDLKRFGFRIRFEIVTAISTSRSDTLAKSTSVLAVAKFLYTCPTSASFGKIQLGYSFNFFMLRYYVTC